MNYFLCNNDIFCNMSPWNKACLVGANKPRQHLLESISHYFGDCFIHHGGQTNRPKHFQASMIVGFRYEHKQSPVELFRNWRATKDLFYHFTNRGPHNLPLRLIEDNMKAIHTRGLQGGHTKNRLLNFLIMHWFKQVAHGIAIHP